jgi:hypothetical protein
MLKAEARNLQRAAVIILTSVGIFSDSVVMNSSGMNNVVCE